jgi:hypothetical protein
MHYLASAGAAPSTLPDHMIIVRRDADSERHYRLESTPLGSRPTSSLLLLLQLCKPGPQRCVVAGVPSCHLGPVLAQGALQKV